jgi:DNA modification methylase
MNYRMVIKEELRLTEFVEGHQSIIDWTGADQDTQYFTHGLHPYPARMPPHISRRLLRIYSKSRRDMLLDPYCGSGGVLVEGILYDRFSVGVELNPLAVLIARVKTTPLDAQKLMKVRGNLISRIESKNITGKYHIPSIKNVSFWFKPEAIRGLSIIKEQLESLRVEQEILDFFKACFSLTVRKASNIRNGQFKLYGRQGEELKSFKPKPLEYFSNITLDNIDKMRSFTEEMQNHKGKAKVLKGDTRKLLEIDPDVIGERTVKLVITSPPYGDSHTTVAYGQFSRYSALWLGLPEDEVLTVDDRGLGGRIIRKEANLDSPILNSILSKIGQVDEYRAKEVFSYFYDADLCLEQITKSMIKGGSRCCYVLANRTVRRVKIPTDEIFVEIGRKYGLQYITTFRRDIPNKYMSHVNAPENIPGQLGSTMTKESIVIWKY